MLNNTKVVDIVARTIGDGYGGGLAIVSLLNN